MLKAFFVVLLSLFLVVFKLATLVMSRELQLHLCNKQPQQAFGMLCAHAKCAAHARS